MTAQSRDERLQPIGLWQRLLLRPELGSIAGLIVVFTFFALMAGSSGFLTWAGTRNYLEVAAQLGILASAVALLMIAGEFDLSVSSMIGVAAVSMALLAHPDYGNLPLGLAILLTLGLALSVGYLNGYLVLRTGLPSFIVTLAMMFILAGANIGFTKLITKLTIVSGLNEKIAQDPIAHLFTGTLLGLPAAVWWWLGVTGVLSFVLLRTPFGNWIFGAGGDANAARNVGVPVRRVKITLFMLTAAAATLLATIQVMGLGSANVLQGQGKELEAIAAAVIGGCLLTGGYGSVIGAGIGALILAIVQQGIIYTNIDLDWFKVMVGGMILGAVILNNHLRKLSMQVRR
ncbi:ABC transporter permease [Meiothermus taiwanensis]|jgi:simple sugar transport system permease protein|uniref:Xylose transport system permease protein XylH n=2 Tax=Meiothermus taiwanensis TaxID=172827 RepID=A0A399DYI6_9DEIN|nr:ABC transporter permease [Meiothermus taiwanensis]AWR86508.1 sugar ABC transporter permease protein [Meiothermus taiwanensis WR-220]KIQ54995.1 ATPase [Meiothermus taiwanensis]KZK16574.1 ATPase [Meiothermus taiwanensis]RIH75110.1 Inner membrane ABC transporter permease protein YjfF [Meiothermus taiwanensis]